MSEETKSIHPIHPGSEDENILVQQDQTLSWIRLMAFEGYSRTEVTGDNAVILLLMEGCVHVYMNGYARKVSAGEMFLIPHATSYQAKVLEDSQLLACRFNIDILHSPDYPIDTLTPFCRKADFPFAVLPMVPLLWNFSSFVHTCLGESIHSLPFFERKKLELFDLLFACYGKKDLAELLCPVFREGLSFRKQIFEHYQQVGSLNELIELTGHSRSGFYRSFTLYFAKSPYDWMLEQKAIRIRRDLISGISPKEITYRYDFSSMSHLTQFCRKHFDMTPSQIARLDITQKKS